MLKKITALMLICSMALTLFACGKNENPSENGDTLDDNGEVVTNASGDENGKIGCLNLDFNDIYLSRGGMFYKSGDRFGVISPDGKQDTGAKYVECDFEKNYFVVSTTGLSAAKSVAEINCYALIDGNGKEIIPQKYAFIEVISDRYAKVIEVTGTTNSFEDELVYLNVGAVISMGTGDETKFKGTWYIYDLIAGKTVDGVYGTKSYSSNSINVYGEFIEYRNDNKEKVCVDGSGKAVDKQTVKLFVDGSYTVTQGDSVTVYGSDKKSLFTCTFEEYVPFSRTKDSAYFISKKDSNAHIKWAVTDEKGDAVSVEFDKQISDVVGNLIVIDEEVFNFNGEKVTDGEFLSVQYNEETGCYYLNASSGNADKLIKEDGTVLCSGKDEELLFDYSEGKFAVRRSETDAKGLYEYYCYADNAFTIKAIGLCSTFVCVGEDVVDTVSGKTVVSGYTDYKAVYSYDGMVYVYAQTDNGVDIYSFR